MLFGKKKDNSELEYLENQINEQKEYLNVINNDIKSLMEKKSELQDEYDKLKRDYDLLKSEYNKIRKYSIEYVDALEGLEFEEYVSDVLKSIGYCNVSVTKASNDYGVDILAEKDNIRYAIQCKNYNSPLGNTCVQEVYSGKNYYNCHVAVVVTNSTFTKNAVELAQKDGVLLWDRNVLTDMIKKYALNNGVNPDNGTTNNNQNQKDNRKLDYSEEEYDDPLYDEIVEFVITTGKASATLLQRKFKLGYNRSARIIDLLEERGIIGPQNGSKPREVLVAMERNEDY